jgi:hypothetical protein
VSRSFESPIGRSRSVSLKDPEYRSTCSIRSSAAPAPRDRPRTRAEGHYLVSTSRGEGRPKSPVVTPAGGDRFRDLIPVKVPAGIVS